MPSKISSWPTGWPSFTPADDDPSDTFSKELKASIISEYSASALRTSWVKTCAALEDVTARLRSQGKASVPVLSYDEVVSPDNADALKRMKAAGCFIVRGVIPTEVAAREFEDLQTFIADNKGSITGWPAKSVAIYHLYSTPTQLRLKTDPRHLKLQRLLNSLWGDMSCSSEELEAEFDPVLYPDALRIRAPGQEFLGLGPHIDAGSLARWANTAYRKTYNAILSGKPEDYDPYDMTHRKTVNPAMFPSGPHSSVLRTFQGRTALKPGGPGQGGLMLVPNIKTVTAYMILRPFFKAPEDGDWTDAEKWEIDEASSWFPGTYRWDSQLLSPASHPHLCLEDTLLSIPEMQPGDTVWWHADMCHAVETTHNGTFLQAHWEDLVAGIPPDDYKYLDGTGSKLVLNGQNERKLKGALPLDTVSAEGRRGLGEGI
ncbi:hypothetical protein LTR85_011646 [Meristemomyces frigidus]|nr:hypothetical protein LTR85_011646 [Meristemomyces frigidus]